MRAAVRIILAGVVLALAPASAALAHDGFDTAAGHLDEDATHAASAEPRLSSTTRAVTRTDVQAAAAAAVGNEQDVGQWGPVVDWPVVGVHVALLPNGKMLAYDSVGDKATETYQVHDHTRATVWDPATGTQTPVDLTGYNVFCSGLAHLMNGSVFVAGGNKDAAADGIRQTHVFDPSTSTWSIGQDMAFERW